MLLFYTRSGVFKLQSCLWPAGGNVLQYSTENSFSHLIRESVSYQKNFIKRISLNFNEVEDLLSDVVFKFYLVP